MEYTREYWQPRIATNPNRFRKLNDSTDYVELINEPEAITQAGTAFTADRLNNMESGIAGAVAGVNEIQGVVDFTDVTGILSALGQESRVWSAMTTLGNDVYACVWNGVIYKQTNGVGDFISLGQASRYWYGMTTLGNDVYACENGGDIYKQTNGTGDFIALGQESKNWTGMTTRGNDVYACVYNGDIYKQTNGTGDFIALGQDSKDWRGMTALGNDVYACVFSGDIYKQTNGTGDFIALGQDSKDWRGMTTRGNDVYACVWNGDIYKQTNGVGDFISLGQTSKSWRGMTTLDSVLYACVEGGDIYTATILTGNTFRASSSFTLPAMPDGARKRILNTHATNAITVTAYTGTTIEGQATMTLSAGHEVEIELIGTVWRKTGWNEKSLASFLVPVDCTSRVAEYTGDGIPLIPDNVAGITYLQDAWATTDGWSGTGCVLSVSGGNLLVAGDGSRSDPRLEKVVDSRTKTFIIKIENDPDIQAVNYYNGSGVVGLPIKRIGNYIIANGYNSGSHTNTWLYIVYPSAAIAGTKTAKVDFIYIGTGAYDTPALDRAGNGNSLTLNAVTPVNGKYGKEMSFNGSTSYAQASSPVIGTTGTVAVRFKRNAVGTLQALCANRASGLINGFELRFDASNSLSFALGGSSQQGITTSSTITDTTTYHIVIITYTNTECKIYIDGVLVQTTAITITNIVGSLNLTIGIFAHTSGYHFNGIISHFRYDSRIWTADEARAWSLNPISIDSRV